MAKITKKDNFQALRSIVPADRSDLIEFIDHELELLAKKNSGEQKPTKTQVENEGLKAEIAAVLSDVPQTVSEIQTASGLTELSNQKVSALLRSLINEGKALRAEDKRKAKFIAIA